MHRPISALICLTTLACSPSSPNIESPDSADAGASSSKTGTGQLGPSELPDDYEFMLANPGAGAHDDFYETVAKPGPTVIAGVWFSEEVPEALAAIVKREFGDSHQREARLETEVWQLLVELDPAELEAVGLTAPTGLWLVGETGPCQVRATTPILSWYTWGRDSVELSWRLEGCSELELASEVAVVADALPEQLHYVGAEQRKAERVELGTLAGDYAEFITEALERDPEFHPSEVWIREVVIPGSGLTELTVASVYRDPGADGRPPEPCGDEQRNVVFVGVADEHGFQRVDLKTDAGPVWDTELRGAFVLGSEAIWTVHESFGQAYVNAVLRSPPTTELTVAHFHPEDTGHIAFAQTEYCGP